MEAYYSFWSRLDSSIHKSKLFDRIKKEKNSLSMIV